MTCSPRPSLPAVPCRNGRAVGPARSGRAVGPARSAVDPSSGGSAVDPPATAAPSVPPAAPVAVAPSAGRAAGAVQLRPRRPSRRQPCGPAAPAKPAANIDELIAKAQKQEQAKRYNEYVKTLIELAEAVDEPAEKIDYYTKAADLYTTKFSNAAEAVKCFEAILALDPEHAQAIDFLRQSYEKRRDWEKLIGLMRREAGGLPEGAGRAQKFLEIAKLATERVKKPETCIELWNEVIASDPENSEALNALAGLHERAKDYPALAAVLEKQVDTTFDAKAKEALLGKLGALYGERLNDDGAAVEAWRQLLTLNPSERKAQEALKKLYLKLGRWDDLEVFYAESGKWDEFIRVLESQEAKETDDAVKISLLMKIAELWMAQKGKPDRAARAYEKVLSIDAKHLAAAEALIPLYEQAGNPKGLSTVIEVKLAHDQDHAQRLELFRQVAGLYETKLKDPPRAFERFLSAFELVAWRRAVRRGRRASGARHLRLGRAHRVLRRGDRPRGRGPRQRPRHRPPPAPRPGAPGRGQARGRRALAVPRRLRRGRRERRGDRRARAALPGHRALRRPARHLREEARPDAGPGRSPADPLRDRPPLRERAQGPEERDRDLPPGPRRRGDGRAGARRARQALRRGGRVGALRRDPEEAHRHRRRGGAADRSEVPPRIHALDAPRRSCRRARELPGDPPPRRGQRRGARRARGHAAEPRPLRRGGRDPRGDLRGPQRLGAAHPGPRDPRRGGARRGGQGAPAPQGRAHRRREPRATSPARSTPRPAP